MLDEAHLIKGVNTKAQKAIVTSNFEMKFVIIGPQCLIGSII